MEIGKDVVLQKFSGDKVEEFDGIVIGVNRDSLNIAYFDQSKSGFLGGVDWRLAFERVNDVKHADHADVQAGKEGFAYRLDAEDAAAEVVEAPAQPESKEKIADEPAKTAKLEILKGGK